MIARKHQGAYLVTVDGQGEESWEPLPRCSECRHHGTLLRGTKFDHELKHVITCDVRPLHRHITERDGFCHLGEFGRADA